MALTVETSGLFGDDMATNMLIGEGLDALQVDVIAGVIEQGYSEMDGSLIERWELLVKLEDFPSLYVDEELIVNSVTWKIEKVVNEVGGMVSVHLIRYLS